MGDSLKLEEIRTLKETHTTELQASTYFILCFLDSELFKIQFFYLLPWI